MISQHSIINCTSWYQWYLVRYPGDFMCKIDFVGHVPFWSDSLESKDLNWWYLASVKRKNNYWLRLVVDLPLWKNISQLGSLFPKYGHNSYSYLFISIHIYIFHKPDIRYKRQFWDDSPEPAHFYMDSLYHDWSQRAGACKSSSPASVARLARSCR